MHVRSWLVTLAFFLASCGAIRFEVEQAISEQRVPGSPLGGILPDFFPNPFRLTIDVKAETEKRGTGPATAAFLKSLTLNATPAGNPSGTFDFLDEVHVFVEAPASRGWRWRRSNRCPRGRPASPSPSCLT